MLSVRETIDNYNMIVPGDIVGLGVSGGSDSMVLLHYLNALQEELDFELVAIHVDHSIRDNSSSDAIFVQDYCKENKIRFYKFRIDVPKYASENNKSIETAARECRNNVFDNLMDKGIISKIALAHHISDQAETILLHLFRGSGLTGAKGMSAVRNGIKIRPMLETTKEEIMAYQRQNFIPFVFDETNNDNAYARNFIRNQVMPLIKSRWPSVECALSSFGKACAEDSDFIKTQVATDAFIVSEKSIKIPAYCFLLHDAIATKTIFSAFKMLGKEQDIEKKHIEMIKDLFNKGENGNKLSLPGSIQVHKEYEYITIVRKPEAVSVNIWMHNLGSFDAENFGKISIKKSTSLMPKKGRLLLDADKIPQDAIWRVKQSGDNFTKFGGGTKKLKDYFIDIKVPLREREFIPVLASGKKILAIAGYEIADEVKVTITTLKAISVSVKRI